MFDGLKVWKLSNALKNQAANQEAYSAVLELGRLGTPKAIQLLIDSLSRRDGVARSAARELGRLGDARAIKPLAALLSDPEVSQSAAEALAKLGAVDALVEALKSDEPAVRKLATASLGAMGDPRAVEPLVQVLQADGEYAIRTAAATALGQLKDRRAIWVLVGTLKLRDETTPEAQTALEQLRQAATLAMRKIGDPFAGNPEQAPPEKSAEEAESPEVHPRLAGDLKDLADSALISILKELMTASEELSWANLERREPLLPAYFRSYDQRRKTAELIGTEIQRRGGLPLMKKILEQDLAGCVAISNWWAGIGAA